MKTKLLLFSTLLSSAVFAQTVPNGGFETITSDNHISQWAKSFFMVITADTNGVFHADSMIFDNPDNQLYRSTTDAHSGQYAMEMTNAYNYTSDYWLTGGAFVSGSDFYSATFPELVFIDPVQPETFDFYYKYLPAGMDSAQATLTVHDMDGIQIGEASITLGAASAYSSVSVPIVYDQVGPVYAITISFLTTVPGNQPSLGTKFIVDDVALNGNLSIGENDPDNVSIDPNPANNSFVVSGDFNPNQLSVTDLNGSNVAVEIASDGKVNTSSWQNGCYFIHLMNDQSILTKRIIVSHE